MNESEAVWPTVIVDRKYGNYVDSFDVDLEGISEHLKNNGMTDEAIHNLTITFSAKNQGTRHGNYNGLTKNIHIYNGGLLNIFERDMASYAEPSEINERLQNIVVEITDRATTKQINQTLYHELEHAVVNSEGGMSEHRRYFAMQASKLLLKGAGVTVGGIAAYGEASSYTDAISPYASSFVAGVIAGAGILAYRRAVKTFNRKINHESPEELRCNSVEQDDGLVTVSFKPKYLETLAL